jgi:hypothetical protein
MPLSLASRSLGQLYYHQPHGTSSGDVRPSYSMEALRTASQTNPRFEHAMASDINYSDIDRPPQVL